LPPRLDRSCPRGWIAMSSAPPPQDEFDKWCEALLPRSRASARELTVLLLGQTGSGKSSFLNLLCNFPIVMRHGRAAVSGMMQDFRDLRFENDLWDRTVSQTNAATVYEVPMGPLRVRIVDTPGFGDTRGTNFDKRHAQMIVECIKQLGFVRAITIVVSGRESRMTAQLKYVLTEVCAILPKSARSNIVAVFTNTSNPLYLSFDIDALNKLVEHKIQPEQQIYIENPFVLWERSMQNRGKVDEASMQAGLVKAFQDAGESLAKLFSAVASMPRLNTKDFERLYELRMTIEQTTMAVLSELEDAQEQQKRLARQKLQIEHAKTTEDMHKEYTKVFKGERWVFKDAPRHGTFCGVKDCHSNCHAPCRMEKTFDNERFKRCVAFCYRREEVTLQSAAEVDELLRYMDNARLPFHTHEDGGEGTQHETVLSAWVDFRFQGHFFIRGARLKVPGAGTSVGFAAKRHLTGLKLPAKVQVVDESEQDTCKRCGHHRKYHYHDEKVWELETYTDEVVDRKTKKKYEAAKTLRAKQEELLKGVQARIEQCEAKMAELGNTLVSNIRHFEQHGLGRNYALLLQNQRDLLQQHIDASLEGEAGADVSALRKAKAEVEKQLQVVQDNLQRKKGGDPLEWAFVMLGVHKTATQAEVEKQYKEEAARLHPDKYGGGNPERMQQLNEAMEILRKHFSSFSLWLRSCASR